MNEITYAQQWKAGIFSGYSSRCFDLFGKEYFKIPGSLYSGAEVEYLAEKTFGLKMGYARHDRVMSSTGNSTVKNTHIERFEIGFTTSSQGAITCGLLFSI